MFKLAGGRTANEKSTKQYSKSHKVIVACEILKENLKTITVVQVNVKNVGVAKSQEY